jgi:acetoin utilization protein AcuB
MQERQSMLMPNVKRYMTREPYSIGPRDNLERAKVLMREHGVRHLPVVEGRQLVGILSDRDIAIVAAVPGIDLSFIEVRRVMEPPLSVWAEQQVDEVASLMAENRRDCVVVRGGHGVEGIFTATDALAALSEVLRRATA